MIGSLRKDAVFDTCPQCKTSASLRRSRAHGFFERIIKKTGFMNLYRCTHCGWRGVKTNFSFKKITMKLIFSYIALIILVAIIVRFVITKFVIK